jgi:Fur family transcriptional regulator, ferric uptake regulator
VSREDSTPTTQSGRLLRDAGLRRTPVRVAVLDRVTSARQPLGAPEIIRQLGEEIDSVTVYRTLNTLAEHRLVHRVRGEDGAWRYAASPAAEDDRREHPHAHFVCDSCGTVECLEQLPLPEDLVPPKTLGRRYDVSHAELVVHGTCPKCHD